jgi:hypothetical protein
MKFRTLAVFLIFVLAAWLPLVAQQPATAPASSQSTAPASNASKAKAGCACCSHEMASADAAKAEKHDHASMACCNAKTSDAKTTMECCKNHDAKLCAAKDGKSCCDAKDDKSCCGKDVAASTCNSKDAKDCCSAMKGEGCKHAA